MDPKCSDVVDTAEEEANKLAFEKVFGKISIKVVEKAEISATSEEEDEDEDQGEEEEEEDEDEDQDEEEDTDSVESDQEWDVDSFEGCENNSDPEDSEDWRRYCVNATKARYCFDVPRECLPTDPGRLCCGFFPLELDDYFSPPDLTGRQYMEKMIKVVIAKYNETKKKNLELDHIVRAVVILGGRVKAYITFMAKETPEGELVEYQGKAEWIVWQRNIHPLLCRPASEQRQLP